MKFTKTEVMNFKNALRGMRNPKESWCKSDSCFGLVDMEWDDRDYKIAELWADKYFEGNVTNNIDEYNKEYENKINEYRKWLIKNGVLQTDENLAEVAYIGPNDMRLAQQLIKAGPEHRKFMRQIFVSVDITAPLYW